MSATHPPTNMHLEEGRARLREQEKQASELQQKIENAQRALEEVIAESTRTISALEEDKRRVESEIRATREFLSPMRRLPVDVLRQIFLSNFEDVPCCAWTLAGVCTSWRRVVLNMPTIWSKIRLVTTLNSSPEIIRLWLERSGQRVPLDIEIYLHIPGPAKKRVRSVTPVPVYSPPAMTDFFFHGPPSPGPAAPVPLPLPVQIVPLGMQNNIPNLPPPSAMHGHPIYIESIPWRQNRFKSQSPSSSSWGHIVMFYLSQQMHRWKRFVFRFDRQFDSMSALRNIDRSAPLLEEFEVSCGEPPIHSDPELYMHDWQWLPSTDRVVQLPKLHAVFLQYVPFKWSSPLISGNLRTINIRSFSTPGLEGHTSAQMTVDRLLHIISSNPTLENLSLYFQNAQVAVLPLETTRLNALKTLNIGGAFSLAPLIDALVTPALESLTLDIDREAPEESISALLARSNNPPISFLSLSYQSQLGLGPYYGDGPPGVPPWGFLSVLPHIKTLQVGHATLDTLVDALAHVDDDSGAWLVPELENLALRNCHAHGDSVPKLIALVEARNPGLPGTNHYHMQGLGAAAGSSNTQGQPPAPFIGLAATIPPPHVGGAGHPTRLKSLELQESAPFGEDIVRWLRSRVPNVKISEPNLGRGIPRSPSYYPVAL